MPKIIPNYRLYEMINCGIAASRARIPQQPLFSASKCRQDSQYVKWSSKFAL